jgi:hypothetical protein
MDSRASNWSTGGITKKTGRKQSISKTQSKRKRLFSSVPNANPKAKTRNQTRKKKKKNKQNSIASEYTMRQLANPGDETRYPQKDCA